jgi:hypothetical protein
MTGACCSLLPSEYPRCTRDTLLKAPRSASGGDVEARWVRRARGRTARADPARRGRMARAISRRPTRGCDPRAARPGGSLRADRIRLPGLREGPSVLPPRQLAVLILRDVLGFHANKVADMLDSTVEWVNTALKRARASLQRRRPLTADREPPPASDSPSEDATVAKFVSAYESADLTRWWPF